MQVSIQTDKRVRKSPIKSQSPEQAEQSEPEKMTDVHPSDEAVKQRRIKRLTMMNKQLIEKLKEQSDQLSKKISKQKIKSTSRSTSVKTSMPKVKENESVRKQLSNAYKQIDMYKSVLTNLKAKQISIDSLDKINQLENRVKFQENVIDSLQKQVKYLNGIKNQQEKQLRIYENDDVKKSVVELEKEVFTLKQKLKNLKKAAQKRQQTDKKQQAYQIQLEKALRKLNDEYYPGKNEKKDQIKEEEYHDISQREWRTVKSQLEELKKIHQENGKKIQYFARQKNRQIKSSEQNDLKLKEKNRKLQTLKSKLEELTKLVRVRGGTQSKKENTEEEQDDGLVFDKNKSMNNPRQVKKWMIPQGYVLEKGKILPNSIFFSDKTILAEARKSKIIEVSIWADHDDIPNILQFTYSDESKHTIEGIQPVPNVPSSLELSVFKMKEGDYLHKTRGKFLDGEIISLELVSKYGKTMKFQGEFAQGEGEPFGFEPRPNQIPSAVFGAYVRKPNDDCRICHLGMEFTTDW